MPPGRNTSRLSPPRMDPTHRHGRWPQERWKGNRKMVWCHGRSWGLSGNANRLQCVIQSVLVGRSQSDLLLTTCLLQIAASPDGQKQIDCEPKGSCLPAKKAEPTKAVFLMPNTSRPCRRWLIPRLMRRKMAI